MNLNYPERRNFDREEWDLENLEIASGHSNPFAISRNWHGARYRCKREAHSACEWWTESGCRSFHAWNRGQLLAPITNHRSQTCTRCGVPATCGHGHHEEIVTIKARIHVVQQNEGAPKQRRPNEQNQ